MLQSFVTRTLPVCCGVFMCRDTRYHNVTACEVNYKVTHALIFLYTGRKRTDYSIFLNLRVINP